MHWWRSALQRRNCVPLKKPSVGELAIVGTDASDLACGELVWLDGAREETTLLFLPAAPLATVTSSLLPVLANLVYFLPPPHRCLHHWPRCYHFCQGTS